VDLRGQGDEGDVFQPGESLGEDAWLAFGSNFELVVLYHSIKDPVVSQYETKVRASVIDTRTGTVVRTREWTKSYGTSEVFATANGNYALIEKGTVLYGPGLTEEIARSPHYVTMVSPSGGRFASSRSMGKEVWMTMDAATLTDTGVVPYFDFNRSSIADRSIARLVLGLQQGPHVEISTEGRSPVIYQRLGPQQDYSPRFVSEEVLAVVSEDRIDVITVDGKLLFSVPEGWDSGTHICSSRDGRRMAVTQERYSGHWQLLESERVTVYDLASRTPIWRVVHKGLKGAFDGKSGIALSPDGSLLAIDSHGLVTLYKVPEPAID
jgi:hypothetical protein